MTDTERIDFLERNRLDLDLFEDGWVVNGDTVDVVAPTIREAIDKAAEGK